MKVGQKDSHKTSGSGGKPSKSLKKSKAVKKPPEKVFRGLVSRDSRQLLVRQAEKNPQDESRSSPSLPVAGQCNVKTPQVEKWKQEGSDWKTMKKVDYQRLETVLEEVQLSSEATCSKVNSDEMGMGESKGGARQTLREVQQAWPKSRFYNLKSLTDFPHEQEKHQQDQRIKRNKKREREDKLELGEDREESTASLSKAFVREFSENDESDILNKMIEIFPIFSNDKFVCSRDAISVEETDDLEAIDKHSGKTLFDGKSARDPRTIDVKHLLSINCAKKTFCERLTEKLGDFKEPTEKKFRHKILIDKNITQPTSSHFIK